MENCKKKVSVIIIDSGIETSVSDVGNYVIASTGYRVNPEGFISEFPDIKPNGIHGTSMALIIRDICKNVQLTSINILDERMSTDSRIMIYAMNEAIKLEPDIIHMSLATTRWRYKGYMKEIVNMAIKKNITIVAACNNNGFWAYPANIKGVIRVKSSKECTKYQFYKKGSVYYAPFTMKGIEGANEFFINKMVGTSTAAAYISGHVANIICNEDKKTEILNLLNKKALKY